ncbi:Uncharacterised protein [Serratia fonticola]|nr:Uncharacterised protein [Serratia fonticola]CAI1663945.1 Uncharacterised protein [Serratia fonticola]CAI1700870.1 Uncharacterised protein [Serratia fonticola]
MAFMRVLSGFQTCQLKMTHFIKVKLHLKSLQSLELK